MTDTWKCTECAAGGVGIGEQTEMRPNTDPFDLPERKELCLAWFVGSPRERPDQDDIQVPRKGGSSHV